jgi:hypothetical protein
VGEYYSIAILNKSINMKKKHMLVTILIAAVVLILLNFVVERELHFEEEVLIEKNIDEVWGVLGDQFSEAHIWATNFKSSEPGGEPKLSGLDYLHRETMTENGENFQELDKFDPANYSLSYHVSKGVPGIAKSAIGEWSLHKITDNQTRMNVHFILKTKGLKGFILSPIISKKIGLASAEIVEELKYYMENGKPHPRKLAAQ